MTIGMNSFETSNTGAATTNVAEDLGFTTLESVENSLSNINSLIEKYGEDADLKKIKANLEGQVAAMKN